jgi:peptidoglycan/xylan/chitin deacetylase (PgdA/CDA1 family)
MAFNKGPITLVMYHYVRDLANSRYPAIRGLTLEKFEGQLDYIQKYYTVVGFRNLLEANRGGTKLPSRPCVLTFDDGLMDHYVEVMPRLMERGITGIFYPVTKAMEQRNLLEVHKLHFILASVDDDTALLGELVSSVHELEGKERSEQLKKDFESFQNPRRFDNKVIAFVKKQLQFALHPGLRSSILDSLYREHVNVSENVLARELYLAKHHLKSMVSCGMEIGGHGMTHRWLNHLNREEQRLEITSGFSMLKEIGAMDGTDWMMSYPFSGYNEVTMELLREMGCAMAITSSPGLVNVGSDPLQMLRLDTNDLPFSADAPISDWTQRAREC